MKLFKIILIILIFGLGLIIIGCGSKRKQLKVESTKSEIKVEQELEAYEQNPNALPEKIEKAIKLGKIKREDRQLQQYINAMYFVDKYERDKSAKTKLYNKYLGALMIIDEFERKYPELKDK